MMRQGGQQGQLFEQPRVEAHEHETASTEAKNSALMFGRCMPGQEALPQSRALAPLHRSPTAPTVTAGHLPPHLGQQAAPVGGAACPGERCQHILLGGGSHRQYGKGHEQPAHHSDVGLA